MSYATNKEFMGGQPVTLCRVTLERCSLTFGTSPCTATGEKCYNTRFTCKDPTNFASEEKAWTFIDQKAPAQPGYNFIHALIKSTQAPARVGYGEGIGYRAKGNVTLQDFVDDDSTEDPYYATRTYDTSQGTFFGKWLARNPYYTGRKIEILTGYFGGGAATVTNLSLPVTHLGDLVTDGTTNEFTYTNFETAEYQIESISGPDDKGVVSIGFVDILKKLDDKRAQCPTPSQGKLSADITSAATSATLTPSGIGSTYAVSGIIRIGDELMDFTRSSDTLTLTRAQYGSTATNHSADTKVQECVELDDNLVDLIYLLCNTYAGIPAANLPYNDNPASPDEWDDEKADWFEDSTFYGIISEPTGVETLITELCYQGMALMWADPLTQKVKLKAIAPSLPTDTVSSYDDMTGIIDDSVTLKKLDDERYTRIYISFNPHSWARTKDPEDFAEGHLEIAANEEGANLYGDTRIKTILSRWFTTSARVEAFAAYQIGYARDTPREIVMNIDASVRPELGSNIDISTALIQGATGAADTKRYYVVEVKEMAAAHKYQVRARSSFFAALEFCFFAPDDAVDYSTDTDAYKEAYWYFTDDNGLNSDGTPGDVFI